MEILCIVSVPIPVAVMDLVYNAQTQIGVPGGNGYDISGNE